MRLRKPHSRQAEFINHPAKRKIVRAGRRSGKTTATAILAVQSFLARKRVLYAAPTSEQLDRFWTEVVRSLQPLIDAGILYKNETLHLVEFPGTEARIRAKTAWNADTLRGDYADILILEEWQIMDEHAWELVGAPMLLDNDGDAIFLYTPPSLRTRSVSKARDPMHAAKMYAKAQQDTTGLWAAFHFTSHDNPYLSRTALDRIASDMTALGYRQEVLAEDIQEMPGALWKREILDLLRRDRPPETLRRVVIAIDPAVTSSEQSDETGILVVGLGNDRHGYVLADFSGRYSPQGWADRAAKAYETYKADRIIAEDNNGGEMVELTLRLAHPKVPIKRIHASRGKAARAEPIAALYEQQLVHHIGTPFALEDQLCTWDPLSSERSPDRLDALVWGLTEIMMGGVSGRIMPGL